MAYNIWKKMVMALVLTVLAGSNAFAQSNAQAMRFLMVNAMVQYGQKLYERGDFDEATAVFGHVLFYDQHQRQALEYLKDMGHGPVDISNVEGLKEAIAIKQQSIEKLREQIKQMQANIAYNSEN